MDPKREYNIFLRSIHPTINNNFLMNIISELTIFQRNYFQLSYQTQAFLYWFDDSSEWKV